MIDEQNLRAALLEQLRSWSLAGIGTLPRGTARPEDSLPPAELPIGTVGTAATETDSKSSPLPAPPAEALRPEPIDAAAPYGAPLPLVDRREVFRILSDEVAQCRCCAELVASRTQTVFGVGHLQPRLVFLGEAPGADEDRLGEPFVGAAGQLLNKIITAARLQRDEVYILNAIKCRPRNNRTPTDSEIATCRGYLERQLEILQPEFIVCLGGVAAKSLLQEKRPVSHLRKSFYTYRTSRVLVTYHPSYLLRDPSAKRLVWEDMQMLMREMGL